MAWWKIWDKRGGGGDRTPDYYEEGVALSRQGLYHDALTSFRLSLKHKPNDPACLEQMAVVHTHMGVYEEAARYYGAALELRPRSPSAHYGLAFLLLKAGERRDATRHLRAFLEHARPEREAPKQVAHARRTLERLGVAAGEPTGL
ncbi:MAG: tetratricopeptide repeat protein [Gemmatimonadetes bacterium]|nr:tetratricopeptide repeat protein [Gemmatimonadota bacterium]